MAFSPKGEAIFLFLDGIRKTDKREGEGAPDGAAAHPLRKPRRARSDASDL